MIQNIPNINHLSEFLEEQIGWQLWPFIGLLEADKFFYLLSHPYFDFAVATFVRSDTDINFSPRPDLWHNIFGHVPLLFPQSILTFDNI
ncbi:hypothetical protein ACP6PL_07830 [Dapis sp. BLCC M126]|uniref:hypothetical protein n=1 Tax=Dapis sp. BLCC M126 TaxID=3400189 RepID=UPI003CE98831